MHVSSRLNYNVYCIKVNKIPGEINYTMFTLSQGIKLIDNNENYC